MAYVMLADEAEDQLPVALYLNMTIAQSRHSVCAIALYARFRADSKIKIVYEPDDYRKHALSREAFNLYVLVGKAAKTGEMLAESGYLFKFLLLLPRGKRWVILILYAPARINADSLKVASHVR